MGYPALRTFYNEPADMTRDFLLFKNEVYIVALEYIRANIYTVAHLQQRNATHQRRRRRRESGRILITALIILAMNFRLAFLKYYRHTRASTQVNSRTSIVYTCTRAHFVTLISQNAKKAMY